MMGKGWRNVNLWVDCLGEGKLIPQYSISHLSSKNKRDAYFSEKFMLKEFDIGQLFRGR
jgi:hypothetical protein